jgi:hypothetical protein
LGGEGGGGVGSGWGTGGAFGGDPGIAGDFAGEFVFVVEGGVAVVLGFVSGYNKYRRRKGDC